MDPDEGKVRQGPDGCGNSKSGKQLGYETGFLTEKSVTPNVQSPLSELAAKEFRDMVGAGPASTVAQLSSSVTKTAAERMLIFIICIDQFVADDRRTQSLPLLAPQALHPKKARLAGVRTTSCITF